MEQYLELREWGDKQYHHYADPSHDVLLPDLPPGMGHIRTLVLDLEDVRPLWIPHPPLPVCPWSLFPWCPRLQWEARGEVASLLPDLVCRV